MTLSFHLNSIISPFSTSFTEKEKEKENYFSYILLHSLAVFRAERMFPCQSFRLFLFNELLTVFILFYASSTCKKLHSLEETRYTSMSNHYDRLFSSRHESRVYKKTGNGRKLFECVAREIQVKHREDILMGSEYYFCDNKSPFFLLSLVFDATSNDERVSSSFSWYQGHRSVCSTRQRNPLCNVSTVSLLFFLSNHLVAKQDREQYLAKKEFPPK